MAQLFCLDTSFFINGWHRHYAPDVFPAIWTKLETLMGTNEVFSCAEVLDELTMQQDELYRWAKARKRWFVPPDETVIWQMQEVMSRFPNFAASGGAPNASDPWVIARAKAEKAVLVTDERKASNPPKSTRPPKMPDACTALNVQWLSPLDFLRAIDVRL
ncbi:MAG: DUF4411 family protein [Planctomycetia bacterium]|nr:DUF4411 family protein [Planctomycetia bacterium]